MKTKPMNRRRLKKMFKKDILPLCRTDKSRKLVMDLFNDRRKYKCDSEDRTKGMLHPDVENMTEARNNNPYQRE